MGFHGFVWSGLDYSGFYLDNIKRSTAIKYLWLVLQMSGTTNLLRSFKDCDTSPRRTEDFTTLLSKIGSFSDAQQRTTYSLKVRGYNSKVDTRTFTSK